MKHRIIVAACAALAALAAPAAQAQWPERPVTIIVPFPAGGGTDTFARPLAQQLGMQLGQSVVIDNKGGAGGTVGAGVAAKAKPDGYTFFMGGAHHALAPSLYKSLNYNIQKDFVPVALLAQPPQVIVINKQKLPVKTLGEFIAYAKQHSGEINFGTAGKGSTHHLAGELFALQNGIKLVDVPYQAPAPCCRRSSAGRWTWPSMAWAPRPTTSAPAASCRWPWPRPSARRPSPMCRPPRKPACPITRSRPGMRSGPRGTPKEAVDRMTAEVVKALNQPKIKEIWLANGSATPNLTGAAFGAYVDSEIGRWAKVVKDSGVTLD